MTIEILKYVCKFGEIYVKEKKWKKIAYARWN